MRWMIRLLAAGIALHAIWLVSAWYVPLGDSGISWINAELLNAFWGRAVLAVVEMFLATVLLSATSKRRKLRYGRWYWKS